MGTKVEREGGNLEGIEEIATKQQHSYWIDISSLCYGYKDRAVTSFVFQTCCLVDVQRGS